MSSSSSSARQYQIILIGATGYTGKLIARELSSVAELNAWAISGRDESKLNLLADDCVTHGGSRPHVLVAQVSQPDQLDQVVQKTRVVISAVGPYSLHGESVIASCIRQRTHYTDVTGESAWISTMMNKYESSARAADVRLIPFAGFDSVPSELAALYGLTTFASKYPSSEPADSVRSQFRLGGGAGAGASGGTIHTMLHLMSNPTLSKLQLQLYHLNPPSTRQAKEAHPSSSERDQLFPSYSKESKSWTAPFLMAGINTRVVRRTAALFQSASSSNSSSTLPLASLYPSNFTYNESMHMPGPISAFFFCVTFVIGFLLLQLSMFRRFVAAKFPQGSGPSLSSSSSSSSKQSQFSVTTVTKNTRSNEFVVTSMKGPTAYVATGIFVTQVALLLLQNEPTEIGESGFLTPVTAFGTKLIQRVQRFGITFQNQTASSASH